MLKELADYDWQEAFAYADKPTVCEGGDCSADPFCREDVTEAIHSRDGENDTSDWLMIGRLNDGRFFYLEAGCDYTGWDCQAWGSAWVSGDIENLMQFGITDQARLAFAL